MHLSSQAAISAMQDSTSPTVTPGAGYQSLNFAGYSFHSHLNLLQMGFHSRPVHSNCSCQSAMISMLLKQ